jgi:hypothetical protein
MQGGAGISSPWRCSFPRRPALPLRSSFKDHVERRLGCAPDAPEAGGSDDLAQFCLTSLRAKGAVAAESTVDVPLLLALRVRVKFCNLQAHSVTHD